MSTVTYELRPRGWCVILADDGEPRRIAVVATYTAKYKARQHAQQLADSIGAEVPE
jgi:hypothetical protein